MEANPNVANAQNVNSKQQVEEKKFVIDVEEDSDHEGDIKENSGEEPQGIIWPSQRPIANQPRTSTSPSKAKRKPWQMTLNINTEQSPQILDSNRTGIDSKVDGYLQSKDN